MSGVRLLFRCGHDRPVNPDKEPSPRCWCGERRIARTLDAPAPRIVGHARGPCVESKYLGPIDVSRLMRPVPESVPPAAVVKES